MGNNISNDNWHDAAWAAANLARHAGIAYGAAKSGGYYDYYADSAVEELARVARALGYTLTKVAADNVHATSPAINVMPPNTDEAA